jgi:hypothetical protein
VFARTPRIDGESPIAPSMDKNELRLSPISLVQGPSQNKVIMDYEEWLFSAKRLVSSGASSSVVTNEITASLEEEFMRLQLRKVSEWKRQRAVEQCKATVGAFKATVSKPDHCSVVDTGELLTLPGCSLSHPFSSPIPLSSLLLHASCYRRVLFPCGNPSPVMRPLR